MSYDKDGRRVPGTLRAASIDWTRVANAHRRHMRDPGYEKAPALFGPEVEYLVYYGFAERVHGVGPRLNESGIKKLESMSLLIKGKK